MQRSTLIAVDRQRLEGNQLVLLFRLDFQYVFCSIDVHRYVEACVQWILLCFLDKLILKKFILFCFELSDYHKNGPFYHFAEQNFFRT
jgi:hypothetical protein